MVITLTISFFGVKNIGKPYVKFDEGGLAKDSMDWLLRHRKKKGAETDRSIPTDYGSCPLLNTILPNRVVMEV